MNVHCLQCGSMKSFLMKGEYELWHDEENNISEVLCLRP